MSGLWSPNTILLMLALWLKSKKLEGAAHRDRKESRDEQQNISKRALGVEGVVEGAAALSPSRSGQAEMATVPIVLRAFIGPILAGGVEHQDVQHQLQLTLRRKQYLQDHGAVQPAAFVSPLNAAQVEICPVDEVPILSESKGVRKVIHNNLPLKAWRTNHTLMMSAWFWDRKASGTTQVRRSERSSSPMGQAQRTACSHQKHRWLHPPLFSAQSLLIDDDLSYGGGFVDPLNAAALPVGPVDVFTQQSKAEDMRQLVLQQSLPVTAIHIDHLRFRQKPWTLRHTASALKLQESNPGGLELKAPALGRARRIRRWQVVGSWSLWNQQYINILNACCESFKLDSCGTRAAVERLERREQAEAWMERVCQSVQYNVSLDNSRGLHSTLHYIQSVEPSDHQHQAKRMKCLSQNNNRGRRRLRAIALGWSKSIHTRTFLEVPFRNSGEVDLFLLRPLQLQLVVPAWQSATITMHKQAGCLTPDTEQQWLEAERPEKTARLRLNFRFTKTESPPPTAPSTTTELFIKDLVEQVQGKPASPKQTDRRDKLSPRLCKDKQLSYACVTNTATVTRKKSRPNNKTASKEAVSTSCRVRAAPATSTTGTLVAEAADLLRPPEVVVLLGDMAVASVLKDVGERVDFLVVNFCVGTTEDDDELFLPVGKMTVVWWVVVLEFELQTMVWWVVVLEFELQTTPGPKEDSLQHYAATTMLHHRKAVFRRRGGALEERGEDVLHVRRHARAHTHCIALADKVKVSRPWSQYLSLVAADYLRPLRLIMSLPAVSRLFRTALRSRVIPAANLTTKPAKEALSAGEQAIGMTAFFIAILVPSFWMLAQMEDYKKNK
ncbi:hypothetical protein CCH79_00016577 [Gambusia affinis]|uniref:Uncharacterized protein n=1 Tax=Gambusia affinis TaxID=33528 RepID=A0A315VB13_GAMAF|nr:hypothetical protein CCH79_00016577 [Gambusia affinis]